MVIGAGIARVYREKWLTMTAIGRPTQKTWMINWRRKALVENLRFGAAEIGMTIRLITR